MSFTEHPDYPYEVERLEATMDYIEKVIIAIQERKNMTKEDIKDAYKSLDPADSSLSYVNIMINTKLLDQLEKNYRNYLKIRKKPYFARIDIRQMDEQEIEKLYIGKASLFNENMDPVIIDWRAPIASAYYDGRLGHISYPSPEGMTEAELFLKRQYAIENGKIENMMDIDITAQDAFLQASLASNANERLKDIASTIQAEQNAIIRADLDKTLIVQGAAGSGKTTIALHRIAYLIYTFEKKFDPDQFMIIAPNQLFLNYISEVLPELGVDRVRQTTYVDFVQDLVMQKFNIISGEEKLILMLETDEDLKAHQEKVRSVAGFKGSLMLRDILNRYIDDIEEHFVPVEDFYLGDCLIYRRKEVQHLFLNESYFPAFNKRLTRLKIDLTGQLKKKVSILLNTVESHFEKTLLDIKLQEEESEERRLKIGKLMDSRDDAIADIQKAAKGAVNHYLAKFPKKKLMAYYTELITSPETLIKYGPEFDPELLREVAEYSKGIFARKHVELEDLAPLVYLHYKIFGLNEKIDVKYAVIDEAQDFNLFEFYTLKFILNTERFTILGDIAQGIHSYRAISNWNDVLRKVFTFDQSTYLTLEQSYRTTVEIMEAANKIIVKCQNPEIVLAKPVLRHGDVPEVFQLDNRESILKKAKDKIQALKKEGFHSIAIIGKTHKECKAIEAWMQQHEVKIKVLNGQDPIYNQDMVIVPSYLAKGLEFDAVILICIEEEYTDDDLDLKLLYVAMTRALHRVTIYYKKGLRGFAELT